MQAGPSGRSGGRHHSIKSNFGELRCALLPPAETFILMLDNAAPSSIGDMKDG
jgi:hypothetical protein